MYEYSDTHTRHFLRFWGEEKEPFYRAFNSNFILKKEVYITKPLEDMQNEIAAMIHKGTDESKEAEKFYYGFQKKIDELFDWREYENSTARTVLYSLVTNNDMLAKNVYTGRDFTLEGKYTVDGRDLRINSGAKTVKLIGKVAKALGCDEGFETYRQLHSQVLNQKRLKGNLCLSIHPMDFITMSDNDCGWSSCMAWMEEPGDYRLGTIEMMNSPYVIIAYLETGEDMWISGEGYVWNDKKWRQLYVVTPELILGNKQYPYVNDELQGLCINWVRDLMQKTPGYGPYDEEAIQLRNNNYNIVKDMRVQFNLHFNYMYNDIYDTRLAYVAYDRLKDWLVEGNRDWYGKNLSGAAVCTNCGVEIEPESVDPRSVNCHSCSGSWQCEHCHSWQSNYEPSYGVDGMEVCEYCYYEDSESCEVCGERTFEIKHIYMQIMTDNEELRRKFNYSYYVAICENCQDVDYERLFGPLLSIQDEYGCWRKAFDITQVTDEGLEDYGDLSDYTIEFLKSIRDAESDEERLRLVNENAY